MARFVPVLTVLALLGAAGFCQAGGKDKPPDKEKKAETAHYDLKAADLAKAFEKSPAEALKKYGAPVKGAGGALLNVSGKVRDVKDKMAMFDTESPVRIRLSVDKIYWPDGKAKRMIFDVTEARVVDFRDGVIVMEAQEVVIGNIPDEEKKDTKEKK